MDSLQPVLVSWVDLGMQDWGIGHSLGGILSGLGKLAGAGVGAGAAGRGAGEGDLRCSVQSGARVSRRCSAELSSISSKRCQNSQSNSPFV